MFSIVRFGIVTSDPRTLERPRTSPRAIAMHDFHFVSCSAQPLAHVFGNHDGTMLPAGATEADGQVALAFVNVVGEQVDEQFGDAADEFLRLRKRTNIFRDSRMAAGERTE